MQRHGGPLCAWGRCAAADCDHFFVDTGRRSPQRFCTPRCATRVRVAAHRAHHATG
ncbi:CGNR zinc finger domain-containing protein [Streptacidiphilus albus]|uniref:CGNR zinc finger domain-containing protein n=1 Tax=Streptacidiphilus albus TaxID=105425 RepID=UPI001E51D668|nr:CGNR zinc finger domain-containing protein [Streptacidiphilus albus]